MGESRSHIAEQADSTARRLVVTFHDSLKWLLSDPALFARAVLTADDDHVESHRDFDDRLRAVLPASDMRTLETVANGRQLPGEDFVQLTRWADTRVIYTVDRTLAHALGETDWADTVIPGSVLRALPYPNPLVVLPEPVYEPVDRDVAEHLHTTHGPGNFHEKYVAFTVTGVRDGRWRASSADPDIDGLVLHFFAMCVDDRDRIVEAHISGPDGSQRSLPVTEGMRVMVDPTVDATMAERRTYARSKLRSEDITPGDEIGTLSDRLTNLGLALLTYLVSSDADTSTPRPVRPRKPKRGHSTIGETSVVEVGFTIGRALATAGSTTAGSGTGRTVRPHIRRGHLKNVPYGPRRSLRKIMWIAPTVVNWNGPVDRSTVHVR